jgi:hypothetical protein
MKPEIHRIFCLSKNPKNILMWSHYADNHSGVCIGYKVHRVDNKIGLKFKKGTFLKIFEDNYFGNIFWPIVKVEYSDIRPEPIEFEKAKKDDKYGMAQRLNFFSNKSTVWKYEEEYRLLMSKNFINMNPVYIKPGDVKEVIFGLYTPKPVMEYITKDIGNDSGIDFFKVELVPRKYELEIVPLTGL